MKKIHQSAVVSLVLMLVIAFVLNLPNKAQAANLGISAKSAIVVDANTGEILFEKNADVARPPASMTKMMTEYLVQKAVHDGKVKWSTKFNVSSKASAISHNDGFSGVSLRTDYPYTVKALYEALAIYSSNGAAIALAERLGNGSESNFVNQMNAEAKKLGMTNTHYINSTGLDNVDLGQYKALGGPNDSDMTTARDLARLAYHVVNDYPEALKTSSIPQMTFIGGPGEKENMINYNWMLSGFTGNNMDKYKYPGVDGLKTGYTSLAGYCFTGTAKQGNRRIITVVMKIDPPNDPSLTMQDKEGLRFLETKTLMNYGFDQFTNATVIKKGYQFKNETSLPVTDGKTNQVGIATAKSLKVVVPDGMAKKYKPVIHLNKKLLNSKGELVAPVKKGQVVGTATVTVPNEYNLGYLYSNETPTVNVVATADVAKSSGFVLAMRGVGHFITGIFSGAADLVKGLFHH